MTTVATKSPPEFADPLVSWYRANKRSLPWREAAHNPYAVWISEIMLQQTTVAAVIPYYNRWMDQFPTVESVAAADMQDVLRYWSGLGYYARARNIKKSAIEIVERFGGQMPQSVADLITLPGIGPYTAGAISSIAFGHSAPIVDGNVTRILSRLHAIDGDVESASTRRELWRLAAAAIPAGQASDFNQAMMELGAVVCLPGAPRCGICPLPAHCESLKTDDPLTYPRSSKAARWVNQTDCCVAIENCGKLLFVRRPEQGVWAGLWELPRATMQADERADDCAGRAALETIGAQVRILDEFGRVKHTVMNRRIALHGLVGSLDEIDLSVLAPNMDNAVDLAWHTPESALAHLPISSPQRKMLGKWLAWSHEHIAPPKAG